MKKQILTALLMRGGKTSHTIMSGYYKYFSASLANNASARNFLLEANEEDKRSGAGDELQRQRNATEPL